MGTFGTKPFQQQLRNAVVAELKQQRDLKLTSNQKDAKEILTGFGDIYVRAYLSKNPRVRYVTPDAKPIYGGYLSLELDDADQNPVWSYQISPARFNSPDVAKEMAQQIVKHLKEFLDEKPAGSQ